MDKILMRHDDVNTFGVMLYVAPDKDQSTLLVLYKDEACTELVRHDEAATLLPKVSLLKFVEYSDEYIEVYSKIIGYNISKETGTHHVYAMIPSMQSGSLSGFDVGCIYINHPENY